MPVLGAATLELNADAAKLERDLGAAVQKATTLGTAIGAALYKGVEMGAAKLKEMVVSAVNLGEEISKGSTKLGVSAEQFSAIAVEAQLADVSVRSVSTAMRTLALNSTKAARDMDREVGQAFVAMGIEVETFGGNTQALFDAVVAKLNTYADSAEKTALGTKVLGRGYQDLKPLIEEHERLKKIAEEVGLVFSDDMARASERFNDNLKIAKLGSQAMGATIANVLLPTLERFSSFMAESAKNTERLDTVARVADAGLKLLAMGGALGAGVFKTLGDLVGSTAAQIEQALSGNFVGAIRIGIERVHNLGDNIAGTVDAIRKVWAEGAAKVQGEAVERGEQIAAPAFAAIKKVREAKAGIDKELQEYMRIFRLQEDDRQRGADDAAAVDRERMAMLDRANAIKDSLDPARAIQREIHEIQTLWKGGWFGNDDDTPQNKIEQLSLKLIELNTVVGNSTKDANTWARDLGLTFESAFESAVAGGKKFSDVLRGISADIAKLITRKTVTEPAGKAIEEMLKGADIGSMFSRLFGGARAAGGPVSSGMAYLVGERGPELFVPSQSGSIVPSGAGGGVSISPTYNIDARADRAAVIQAIEAGNRRLRADLESELAHGGAFRHAVGTA